MDMRRIVSEHNLHPFNCMHLGKVEDLPYMYAISTVV